MKKELLLTKITLGVYSAILIAFIVHITVTFDMMSRIELQVAGVLLILLIGCIIALYHYLKYEAKKVSNPERYYLEKIREEYYSYPKKK